ncbi:RES family NAD+ phosphorylase [Phenylobacterium montanum]|uniref:RES domain-containing protein n=1 Tax=Phenylobacterium montanum TaxID=2823693 RepID=A0A975FZL8_9CAUL|nr:RES domain-containing protein [Caulobacter sp. S6]QUD87788.1 RES domain-containing protein [Caulobacter sp. S6]
MTARRAQVLDRTHTAYRIGDPDGAYPIYDATGSRLYPGRWNTPATPVIYASQHYSTAMLEKLAHGSGQMPPNQHFVEITIDAGVSYEVFSVGHNPGWDLPDARVAKAFGEAWVREGRSAILLAPSLVARMEQNIVINPAHPDAARIRHGLHQPVWWDRRLFG